MSRAHGAAEQRDGAGEVGPGGAASDRTEGRGDVVPDEMHDSARRAQRRAADLRERTAAVLADSQQTIELARTGELGSRRLDELVAEVAGLRRAMETRAVIEQAKGIIIATVQCDPDAAFTLLAQQSQHENRKLVDVATDLVRSKARPTST